MHFSKSTTRRGNKSIDERSAGESQAAGESPEDNRQDVSQDTLRSISEVEEVEDSNFPELSDIIEAPWRCPAPQAGNIFE